MARFFRELWLLESGSLRVEMSTFTSLLIGAVFCFRTNRCGAGILHVLGSASSSSCEFDCGYDLTYCWQSLPFLWFENILQSVAISSSKTTSFVSSTGLILQSVCQRVNNISVTHVSQNYVTKKKIRLSEFSFQTQRLLKDSRNLADWHAKDCKNTVPNPMIPLLHVLFFNCS